MVKLQKPLVVASVVGIAGMSSAFPCSGFSRAIQQVLASHPIQANISETGSAPLIKLETVKSDKDQAATVANVIPTNAKPEKGTTDNANAKTSAPIKHFTLDTPKQDTPPQSRALPSPLPSPPFPGSDWLGFPLIGAPYTVQTGALQKMLPKKMTDDGFLLYGWLNPSINYSTSKNSNLPLTYDLVPNKIQLDQAIVVFEKQPDTVQTTHEDWGFRFLNLYGIDYRYTIMRGILSDQLLKRNALYGYDPVEMYMTKYYPKVAQGMVVRVGRFISPPDIEAQLTPQNYLFTHSQMFSIDPYTFIGAQATIRYSDLTEVQFGFHWGNDMAPWTKAASLNGQLLLRHVSRDGNDAFWGGINSLGSGKYHDGHDNLQHIVGTWGHKFSEKYHMMTELYYMFMYDGAVGGTENDGPPGTFGGGGGIGTIIPGKSEEVGAVNYFQILLDKNDYVSIRTDYLKDAQGQRTGYPATTLTRCSCLGQRFATTTHTVLRRHSISERVATNGLFLPTSSGDSKSSTDKKERGFSLSLRFETFLA